MRLRCRGSGVHVRALMKGVGSVKRYGKEGSERRPGEMRAFRIKLTSPTAGSGERSCPGGKEKGRRGEGGVRGEERTREGGERAGRERGSEGTKPIFSPFPTFRFLASDLSGIRRRTVTSLMCLAHAGTWSCFQVLPSSSEIHSVQSVRRTVAFVSHVSPKEDRYLLSVATIQADVTGR
jgi:hypothetical protein